MLNESVGTPGEHHKTTVASIGWSARLRRLVPGWCVRGFKSKAQLGSIRGGNASAAKRQKNTVTQGPCIPFGINIARCHVASLQLSATRRMHYTSYGNTPQLLRTNGARSWQGYTQRTRCTSEKYHRTWVTDVATHIARYHHYVTPPCPPMCMIR